MSNIRKQAGDTIVEVLIASAIVGLILTGAFAIANASLRQIRMSQERSEAHRIAASQIELVKQLVDSGYSIPGGDGCARDGGASITYGSSGCKFGTDDRYTATVTNNGNRSYSVKVKWDNVAGREDQVIIDYRTKN